MNLDFHRSPPIDFQVAPRASRPKRSELASFAEQTDRPGWTRYVVWAAFAAGLVGIAASASVTVLCVIGGAIVGLAALATAVCIYAQNNTPVW